MKKRFSLLLLGLLIATPLIAQEEGGGGEGGGAAGVGAGQTQVFTRVDALDPMDQVKTFLAKANVKLTSDQEKALKPDVEAALKQAQDATERLRAQAGAARGAGGAGGERGQRGERGAGGGGGGGGGFRGGRGGGGAPGGFPGGAANGPLAAELKRINDDLITKINATLKPDQLAAFKKFQNDEIRKAGGFAALKLVMDEAGAGFTADQDQQIQALYTEEAQQRGQLMRESQGRPEPAKLDEIEKNMMAKIVRVLNPAQRKALLDSRSKPQ